MDLVRLDTQRAYQQIWNQITTLQMAPGSLINEQQLAGDLQMGLEPVREAVRLLAQETLLVVITPRHGLYVAPVDAGDLERISELRVSLESLSARLAARRATPDDLAVLEALRQEQVTIAPEDSQRLFELDHRFHQAVARGAYNKYLSDTLERYFGVSCRLWHLTPSYRACLPAAVEQHLLLVDAIQAHDEDRAEHMMRAHIQDFYTRALEVLETP